MSELLAGVGKVDITPTDSVWMDGMVRAHKSEGVHDHIYARVLFVSGSDDRSNALIIVSVEVCALDARNARNIRQAVSDATGVPPQRVIVAATHTHSGPATHGFFNPREDCYLAQLTNLIAGAAAEAAEGARPARIASGAYEEHTISHYRRLLSRSGRVMMNWEPYDPADIVSVMGKPDPDVGVLEFTDLSERAGVMCLLFTHAGHPNVMSGDNYLISSDYPGYACSVLEMGQAGVAMFLNGAQGSVDIDGLRDRDWAGVERAGRALADAVGAGARARSVGDGRIGFARTEYAVPARKVSDAEIGWADQVLQNAAGGVAAMADGMGDDTKAHLLKELRSIQDQEVQIEQIAFAVDDTAFITFPGELFTEIGAAIKSASPFKHTYVLGLANGYIGYVPTAQAIEQGGYEPDARRVDASAGAIILERSSELLRKLYDQTEETNG